MEEIQESLFCDDELPETEHEKHWKEMPEYVHKDLQPKYQLIVSFEKWDDVKKFEELVAQKITPKTKSIWYPELKWEKVIGMKQYSDERDVREENEGEGDPVKELDEKMADVHFNQGTEMPEMPEKLFTTCNQCEGTGHVLVWNVAGSFAPYESDIVCHECHGEGIVRDA